MKDYVKQKLKTETVFCVSFLLACSTSFITGPILKNVDMKVIISLFNLMLIINAFESFNVLDRMAGDILVKFNNQRSVSMVMIIITFLSSMLITNDVALITFVPITIIVSRRAEFDPLLTVILQTLAANIGSSLTPMGNPQNLYLYSYYHIGSSQFFSTMFTFIVIGALWLFILNMKVRKKELSVKLDEINIKDKNIIVYYTLLFFMVILSILRIIDYRVIFIVLVTSTFVLRKELFKKVDYFLLATFICFFIVIGNISKMGFVTGFIRHYLYGSGRTYFISIILSQFISNVPSSILVSSFVPARFWREVLLGVDIGGMGTLVASLASVISYKFYTKYYTGKKYLVKFHYLNFISLIIFGAIFYFLKV